MDYNKHWEILKKTGIPEYMACLLRNLYAGQEAIVRIDIEPGLVPNRERSMSRLYIVTLLNLYAEHIMYNAGLD